MEEINIAKRLASVVNTDILRTGGPASSRGNIIFNNRHRDKLIVLGGIKCNLPEHLQLIRYFKRRLKKSENDDNKEKIKENLKIVQKLPFLFDSVRDVGTLKKRINILRRIGIENIKIGETMFSLEHILAMLDKIFIYAEKIVLSFDYHDLKEQMIKDGFLDEKIDSFFSKKTFFDCVFKMLMKFILKKQKEFLR